jgi:hypothetical protein
MPKGTKEPQENGLLDQDPPIETEDLQDDPNAAERKDPPEIFPKKLTVNQFLNHSPQKPSIDGLIRSLYLTEINTFEEWEKKIALLLKRKIT